MCGWVGGGGGPSYIYIIPGLFLTRRSTRKVQTLLGSETGETGKDYSTANPPSVIALFNTTQCGKNGNAYYVIARDATSGRDFYVALTPYAGLYDFAIILFISGRARVETPGGETLRMENDCGRMRTV